MFDSKVLDSIEVLTQSSIRIGGDQIIYIDPLQIPKADHDADMVLITHDHWDHFSPDDLQKVVNADTVLVVPELLEERSSDLFKDNRVVVVKPDQKLCECGTAIETIPAYNNHKPFHPQKKGWVGYILTIGDTRVYIAGDTDATPDNRKVTCDIAMVPIGGTYTMTAKKAAELINQIRPTVAIPIHYGNIVGKPEDAEEFQKAVETDIRVVIKL
ncbi:MAG: MBL fold metallo-hydrolase [Lachnospiraceae bacterium]|nr:MBL fold metallo-hydrolase [Lachnospiraceae bacterium]